MAGDEVVPPVPDEPPTADELATHKKAIKVIGGHKAVIARVRNTLLKVKVEVPPEMLGSVKAAESLMRQQLSKIEDKLDDLLGNPVTTDAEVGDITQYILEQRELLEVVVTALPPPAASPGAASNISMHNTSRFNSTLTEEGNIKLPKLALPTFNGTLGTWASFWEALDILSTIMTRIPTLLKHTI